MNQNLLNALSSYCTSEIDNLKNNELFIKLKNLVKELNYILICEYGKALDNKSEDLYLSIEILNDKNEIIKVYEFDDIDETFLCASTPLVLVDKKKRYKFSQWNDEEFIEDLNWLIKELEKIKKGK